MRIFLTGATGYLGKALVRRLAAQGHHLVAVVRQASLGTRRVAELEELGVVTFPGDITDRFSLREPMAGADWVFHLAAELDPDASLERMRDVNVAGSEAVASLAYKLGVGRFLSVSSIAYFGGSAPDGTPSTEESPVQMPFPSAYSLTKHEGELAIRQWARRGLRVNTVYPSLIYGPPGKGSGANWLLRSLARGRFPALVGAGQKASWVHVDDVVDAVLRVVDQAPVGRDYLLAGDIVTVRELATRVAALSGVRPPRWSLRPGVARVISTLAAPLFRLAGKKPPLPASTLENLARHWAFDDGRARRELNWQPRDLAAGLPPTLDYLLAA